MLSHTTGTAQQSFFFWLFGARLHQTKNNLAKKWELTMKFFARKL